MEDEYIKRFYTEYYKPKPSPIINIGPVTKWLIIICTLIYVLLPDNLYPLFMFKSDNILKMPWILITNAFLHANIVHLFFNMFSLFMFGSLIELRYGSKIMLILFFTSVVIANLAFGLIDPHTYGLGISSYIYALIGAAVVLEPNAQVIFPIGFILTTAPVRLAGPIMFIGELVYGLTLNDGVGHIAHAAGFIVGVAISKMLKDKVKYQLVRF